MHLADLLGASFQLSWLIGVAGAVQIQIPIDSLMLIDCNCLRRKGYSKLDGFDANPQAFFLIS